MVADTYSVIFPHNALNNRDIFNYCTYTLVNPCIKDAFSRLMCSLQTCNKEPPHREPLENLPHQDNKETHLLDLNETLYLIYNMISFN